MMAGREHETEEHERDEPARQPPSSRPAGPDELEELGELDEAARRYEEPDDAEFEAG